MSANTLVISRWIQFIGTYPSVFYEISMCNSVRFGMHNQRIQVQLLASYINDNFIMGYNVP